MLLFNFFFFHKNSQHFFLTLGFKSSQIQLAYNLSLFKVQHSVIPSNLHWTWGITHQSLITQNCKGFIKYFVINLTLLSQITTVLLLRYYCIFKPFDHSGTNSSRILIVTSLQIRGWPLPSICICYAAICRKETVLLHTEKETLSYSHLHIFQTVIHSH